MSDLVKSCGDDKVLEIRTAKTVTFCTPATNTVVISSNDESLWRYNQNGKGETWAFSFLSGIINLGLGSRLSRAERWCRNDSLLFSQAY